MATREHGRTQSRRALETAAAGVFAEQGYGGATMGEIAKRAGVAKGTPYLHFHDKADLFYAVFEAYATDILNHGEAALQAQGEGQPASARFRALALGAVDYMDHHREWFPLSMEIWAASNTPALRERFAQALQNMYALSRAKAAAIIEAGQANGEFRKDVDASALATVLTGAIDGLFLQCWFDPQLESRPLVEHFLHVLDHGLMRESGSSTDA